MPSSRSLTELIGMNRSTTPAPIEDAGVGKLQGSGAELSAGASPLLGLGGSLVASAATGGLTSLIKGSGSRISQLVPQAELTSDQIAAEQDPKIFG